MQTHHLSSLWLFLPVLSFPDASSAFNCQNGGTLDEVDRECVCTPYFYGVECEIPFSTSDPCATWSSVSVLNDRKAAHWLGNTTDCFDHGTCINFRFDTMAETWYRLESPAGSNLATGLPNTSVACGSKSSYFLLPQNIVQEDNQDRILFASKALRYVPNAPNGFYYSDATRYRVRILKCSSLIVLYYLHPLPEIVSKYCIGSKKPCDGPGFDPCVPVSQCRPLLKKKAILPQLRLDYKTNTASGGHQASFKCKVFAAFQFSATNASGVKYQIEFELNFRNGTSVIIQQCRWQHVSIPTDKNQTFECKSEFVLSAKTSVYGGSLSCRVRAKCDSPPTASYISKPLESNIHGFYFIHSFRGGVGSDVAKPGQSVSLCMDSNNIPFSGELDFSVFVARPKVVPTDRIEVSLVRHNGDEYRSCGFTVTTGTKVASKKVCQDIVLYNRDPDNRVPFGLTIGQQNTSIKVNISFSSKANGLDTQSGASLLQKFQSIQIDVDLTSLQTRASTYLHVYAGSVVKPANEAYSETGTFSINAGNYTILAHTLHPYEIQIKVEDSYATEIAIRYFYYVFRIYGNSSSGTIQTSEVKHLPPKSVSGSSNRQALPIKSDGLPFGVTVEKVEQAIKVRFDLYGTILYLWFLSVDSSACNKFVMSSDYMRVLGADSDCKSSLFKKVGSERIALNAIVAPGFHDTQSSVEGLIYRSRTVPITLSSKNLFHPDYDMLAARGSTGRMEPTETSGICSCNDTPAPTGDCFVSMNNTVEPRRASAAPSVTEQTDFSRQINQQEAIEFCNEFLKKCKHKSVSAGICSQTKDPTGQTDYISQFKLICTQHAVRLGTFDSTQPLFNSMLGLCYTDMTYNASVVLRNPDQIKILLEDLCPANCSGRGECVNGMCLCGKGFQCPLMSPKQGARLPMSPKQGARLPMSPKQGARLPTLNLSLMLVTSILVAQRLSVC